MKLKPLAAACLVLGSPIVFAQSAPPAPPAPNNSFVLYGNLDIGLSTSSTSALGYAPNGARTADAGSVTKLQDGGIGGSNWGMKGSRDLPNGLVAGFQLQGNVNLGNGALNAISGAYPGPTSALFNQIAKVSLGGSWGSVGVGRQVVPLYYAMVATDVREGRYSGSTLSQLVGVNSSAGWNGTTTNAPLGAIYDDNAIIYTSPKWNGFTGNVEYVPGGVDGNNQAGSRNSVAVQYDNNGLKIAGVYYAANDAYTSPTAATGGVLNNRYVYLGARYDFNKWSVSTSFGNAQNPSGVATGGTAPASAASATADYNTAHVGVGYSFSPMYRVTAGYYTLQDVAVAGNNSNMIAAGLDINLDKQTMLYVQGGQVANHGNANMGFIYGQPVASGETTMAYMVGARYSF